MSRNRYYKIIRPRLFAFLKFKKVFHGFSGIYHNNLSLFDSFPLILFLIISLLIYSVFKASSIALPLSLGLLFSLFINFLMVNQQIAKIRIKRKFQSTGIEREECFIEYLITNPSSFTINDIQIIDLFEGCSEQLISFDIKQINPHTVYRKKIKINLDTGMGEKEFGPIIVNISDPIKLFKYEFEYLKKQTMRVLPVVTDIPIKNRAVDRDAIMGGQKTFRTRGESSNFIGVKEYIEGEPIKKINWKLSLKQHKLILNEFEKDTNSKTLVIGDFDKVKHFGSGAHSTWEYVKDISLSIVNKHSQAGNFVSFLSQEVYLPFQVGRLHLEHIEKELINHKLSEHKDFKYSLFRILEKDVNVFFITTFVQALRNLEHLEDLRKLSKDNNIHFIFIDPFDYFLLHGAREDFVLLNSLKKITEEKLIPFLEEHRSHYFHYDIVKIKADHDFSGQIIMDERP